MKKSEAVEILEDILKEWDGCMLNKKACRKILNRIQKRIGMLPPDRLSHLSPPCAMEFEWQPERPPARK